MQIGAMETILPTKAPDSIDDSHAAGFDGLELNVAGPDPGDDPIWTAEDRTRIRRRAADLDNGIPSLCLGFLNGGGLTMDDPDVRADARHVILRAIDAAAALGAENILVPFFGTGEIETEEHEDRVISGVSRVADAAEAAGVTLAIENTLSAEQNVELIDAIDSPAVGHYYDVGNALSLGYDPVEEIGTLGDRIAQVHFKDRDAEGGSYMLGEGAVDFAGCVDALEAIGYDGWVVLETSSPGDPVEDAATNRAFAEDVLSSGSR